jgi:exodeoxyribonuclease V alpha subunit
MYYIGEIMAIEIEGVVKDIKFHADDTDYTVASFESDGEFLTVVGVLPSVQEGEHYKLTGDMVYHKRYGEQFKAEIAVKVVPSTENGIVNYLASGLIKGVGPKLAERIVEKFGVETMDIIERSPERLREVSGIGKSKFDSILISFEAQREMQAVMIGLQRYGISTAYALKIYKKYKGEALNVMEDNPYRIADEISGIGFRLADRIASKMGVEADDPGRIASGIRYALNTFQQEGHTYAGRDELVKKASEMLMVEASQVEEMISEILVRGDVFVENLGEEKAVYGQLYHVAETGVARMLTDFALAQYVNPGIMIEKEIEDLELNDIHLADKQKLAVKRCIEKGLVVITGGPGTGKTTTINSIIRIFYGNGFKITLAAPTGRAAKRMSQAAGMEAKTIHRLLEYAPSMDEHIMVFGKNEGNQLEADVIIIDEVSMVDVLLMYHLLKAIKPGTRIILVGDADQLPPVGPGNVLRDVIDSGMIPVVRLDEIFRQARESMIVLNAHKINQGEYPLMNQKDRDFFHISKDSPDDILKAVEELVSDRLPNFNGYDPMKDIQVLTPMKGGIVGTKSLNIALQGMLNPSSQGKKEKNTGERIFREGDKIMQIRNNYNIKWKSMDGLREGDGVFNGDIGFITRIDNEALKMDVVFDEDRIISYDFADMDELIHAFCVTIHKSQGSEFPVVVIPLSWAPPMLLNRNIIYTAITRAKELVVLVGQSRYLYAMIKNEKGMKRNSGLLYRFKKVAEFMEEDEEDGK